MFIHGHARIGKIRPEHDAYRNAIQRCTNPKNRSYARYGGRGIEFRFQNYEEFFAAVGPRPRNKSLDRLNNDGHYEKGNVRWATIKEQRNNRKQTKGYKHTPITHCIHGHKFTSKNTYIRGPWRTCITCRRLTWMRYWKRKKMK